MAFTFSDTKGSPLTAAEADQNIRDLAAAITALQDSLGLKQDQLQNAVNIKSINGQSLLGSGDITISSGGGGSSPTRAQFNNHLLNVDPLLPWETVRYYKAVGFAVRVLAGSNSTTPAPVYTRWSRADAAGGTVAYDNTQLYPTLLIGTGTLSSGVGRVQAHVQGEDHPQDGVLYNVNLEDRQMACRAMIFANAGHLSSSSNRYEFSFCLGGTLSDDDGATYGVRLVYSDNVNSGQWRILYYNAVGLQTINTSCAVLDSQGAGSRITITIKRTGFDTSEIKVVFDDVNNSLHSEHTITDSLFADNGFVFRPAMSARINKQAGTVARQMRVVDPILICAGMGNP